MSRGGGGGGDGGGGGGWVCSVLCRVFKGQVVIATSAIPTSPKGGMDGWGGGVGGGVMGSIRPLKHKVHREKVPHPTPPHPTPPHPTPPHPTPVLGCQVGFEISPSHSSRSVTCVLVLFFTS